MIDHVWTVICSRAVIDRYTNNVSIHDVLEIVTIKDQLEPNTILPLAFEVLTLWARTDFAIPARGKQRLTVYSPSGEKIKEHKFDLDLTGNFRRFRTRASFSGLLISEPGRYVFHVELQDHAEEWHQVAAVPLEVVFESRKKNSNGEE